MLGIIQLCNECYRHILGQPREEEGLLGALCYSKDFVTILALGNMETVYNDIDMNVNNISSNILQLFDGLNCV